MQISEIVRRTLRFVVIVGSFAALIYLAMGLLGKDRFYDFIDTARAPEPVVHTAEPNQPKVAVRDIAPPNFDDLTFWCEKYSEHGLCIKDKPVKVSVRPIATPTPTPEPIVTFKPVDYGVGGRYPVYVPATPRPTPRPTPSLPNTPPEYKLDPTPWPHSPGPRPTSPGPNTPPEYKLDPTPWPMTPPEYKLDPTPWPTPGVSPTPTAVPTPTATPSIPPRALVSWPTSDRRMDALFDVSVASTVYEPYMNTLSGAALISSLVIEPRKPALVHDDLVNEFNPDFLTGDVDPKKHFDRFVEFYGRRNPGAMIGSTHAAVRCTFDPIRSYPEPLAACQDLGVSSTTLSLTDSSVFNRLSGYLVDRAVERGLPYFYLKDVPHRPTSVAFLSTIKQRLRANGIRLIADFGTASIDTDIFVSVVDGIALAEPFILDDLSKLTTQLASYRAFLDADRLLVLRSKDPIYTAAMAMLIRKSDDSLFVQRGGNGIEWATWPRDFGAPKTSRISKQNASNWVIEREFERGSITVQQVTAKSNQPVTFDLPRGNNTNFKILHDPRHGFLDIRNFPKLAYSPDWNYYATKRSGLDSFVIGLNFDGQRYRDIVVVGISNVDPDL